MVRDTGRSAHWTAADLRAAPLRGAPAQGPAPGQPLLAGGRGLVVLALLLLGCSGPGRQLRKAGDYLEEGRYKAAARTYDKVYDEHPDRAEALVGAAEAWSLAGEAATALERADAALAAGEEGAELARARALIALGRGAEARALLSPGDQPLLLAEARLAAGDLAGAAEVLPAAGADPAADMLRAWLDLRREGTAACEASLPLALAAFARDDEQAELAAEASWVATTCGDAARAEDLFRVARAFERSDAEARRAEATTRREGGDLEGAARRFTVATAMYPQSGFLARELGVTWLAADQPGRAIAALQQALVLPPYDQDLAEHEIVVGAHGLEPDERSRLIGDLWTTLAVALEAAGDLGNSAAAHERALLVDASASADARASADAWAALADRWLAARRPEAGVRAAKKAVQLDHTSAEAWRSLARAQLSAGQAQDAVGAARKAWALAPGAPDTAVIQARAALAIGEAEEARRVCETALRELGPAVHPLTPTLQALLREADR